MAHRVEIPKQTLTLFDDWTRHVTNTEYLAERLRSAGVVKLEPPREHNDVYRVQPKVTGCERRRALCYLDRHKGCEDIDGRWEDFFLFFGIDLLAPVAELASAETIVLERKGSDHYLWVYVKTDD